MIAPLSGAALFAERTVPDTNSQRSIAGISSPDEVRGRQHAEDDDAGGRRELVERGAELHGAKPLEQHAAKREATH